MAKTKKKKEKIVDLRPEKITDEQLKRVQDTISNLNKTQMEIGQIETRKHELLHNVAVFRDKLTVLQSEFEKEYGTIDVNIQDGTINYPDNGEADKKD